MWDHASDFAAWEKIAQEVHARHSRRGDFYTRSLTGIEHYAHKLVADKASGSRRVLEIGIGGGEHLVYRSPTTGMERYVGLDLSPTYAKICRDKFGVEVICADAADMPFADNAFDCVIAMAILEHVQDLERVLAEVERILEPGGRFLALIPTNGSLPVAAFKALVTYPTMRRRGIARPDLVWNDLNVNSFKRVESLVLQRFDHVEQISVPMRLLPWWLSPLWTFACWKSPTRT